MMHANKKTVGHDVCPHIRTYRARPLAIALIGLVTFAALAAPMPQTASEGYGAFPRLSGAFLTRVDSKLIKREARKPLRDFFAEAVREWDLEGVSLSERAVVESQLLRLEKGSRSFTPEIFSTYEYRESATIIATVLSELDWHEDVTRGEADNGMTGRRESFTRRGAELFRQQWNAKSELQLQQVEVAPDPRSGLYRNGVIFHVDRFEYLFRLGQRAGDESERGYWLTAGLAADSVDLDRLPIDLRHVPGWLKSTSTRLADGHERRTVEAFGPTGAAMLVYEADYLGANDSPSWLKSELFLPDTGQLVSTFELELIQEHSIDQGQQLLTLYDSRPLVRLLPDGTSEVESDEDSPIASRASEEALRRYSDGLEDAAKSLPPRHAPMQQQSVGGGLEVAAGRVARSAVQLEVNPAEQRKVRIPVMAPDWGEDCEVLSVTPNCPCATAALRTTSEGGSQAVTLELDFGDKPPGESFDIHVVWARQGGVEEDFLRILTAQSLESTLIGPGRLIASTSRPTSGVGTVRVGVDGFDFNEESNVTLQFVGDFIGKIDVTLALQQFDRKASIAVPFRFVDRRFGAMEGALLCLVDGQVVDFRPVLGVREPTPAVVEARGVYHLGGTSGKAPWFRGPGPSSTALDGPLELRESNGAWTVGLQSDASAAGNATVRTEMGTVQFAWVL